MTGDAGFRLNSHCETTSRRCGFCSSAFTTHSVFRSELNNTRGAEQAGTSSSSSSHRDPTSASCGLVVAAVVFVRCRTVASRRLFACLCACVSMCIYLFT